MPSNLSHFAIPADDVERAVETQLTTLPRGKIARASWQEFGAIIVVDTLDTAVRLAGANSGPWTTLHRIDTHP